jgi:hypothetical protein
MRGLFRSMTTAVALAAVAALPGTARADPIFEWRYKVDNGAFTTVVLSDSTNNSANVSLLNGKLTIAINTSSNSPGTTLGAELFSSTTDVVNNSGGIHTVYFDVTETGFMGPTSPSMLTADVGPVTIRKVTSSGITASGSFSAFASVSNLNAPFGGGISTDVYSASSSAWAGSVTLANATLSNGAYVSHSKPFSMN